MARIIELTVENKTYTLEFNRKTLLKASDIITKDFDKKERTQFEQYSAITELVKCAFMKNHPNITDDEVEQIIDSIGDLEKFVDALREILEASVNVFGESKGNAHWEVK